jgi:hypothetical protein
MRQNFSHGKPLPVIPVDLCTTPLQNCDFDAPLWTTSDRNSDHGSILADHIYSNAYDDLRNGSFDAPPLDLHRCIVIDSQPLPMAAYLS